MTSNLDYTTDTMPHIVGFAQTLDNSLIVVTYCSAFPTMRDDWERIGPLAPAFFVHVRERSYIIWFQGAMPLDDTAQTLLEVFDGVSLERLYALLEGYARRIV